MMQRRAFIAAATAAAAFPTAAWARRPGDGYETIPYVPRDAEPYYEPIHQLKRSNVDPKIWKAVQRINQSGWVWTAESCQGHKNGWSDHPLIRLVCREADGAAMLAHLLHVVPRGRYENERNRRGGGSVQLKPMPCPRGWLEVRVEVISGGIKVFERFAARL